MLSNLYLRLKKYFYELNLFKDPQVINNRHQIRNQYISTRIFIFSFSIILLSFLIYFLLIRTTIIATTESPTESLFNDLSNQYSDTLKCPCSNLSIPYQTFILIETTFHPICLLNLEPIIDILFNYTKSLSNENDFRFTGALQFRLLTLLCSSVNEIIRAGLIDFNATLFTNIFLLKQSNLENQVEELINQFIQKITSHFLNSLKMIRINTFGSQVISSVRTNYKIVSDNRFPIYDGQICFGCPLLLSYPQIYDGRCNCSTSFLCSSPAFIYDNNQTYIINGFRIGCFILESLLASSLECFYNTSCLNQLFQHIQFNSTLIVSPSNKFNKTDSIEVILNALMVEQWHKSIDYKAYFGACEAKTCSYSYEGHSSLIFIITTILGLIGGFTMILQFIIPIIVAFARKKRNVLRTSNHSRMRRFFNRKQIIKQVRRINLYKSLDSHTKNDIRNEFLSTRIYIIFLVIISSLVVQYRYLLKNTINITIQSPSLDTIININESSMVCPCSMINVPFKTFLSIEPILHPICYSDFIDDIWLNTINTTNNNDARNLQLRFRIISLFCQFAREILQFELVQLSNSYLLSTELLSENQFEIQINVTVERTISMARSTFASSLQLVNETNKINELLSADEVFQPSGGFLFEDDTEMPIQFGSRTHYLEHCVHSDNLGNITLNQFYTNCDPMQALFASSFISFYDKSILESLSHFLFNISNRPLNPPITHSNDATILSILNTLMFDSYSTTLSYKSYFDSCHPQICTYTKISRESTIDTIAAVISFVGGLTGIFHIVIWYIVRLIRRRKRINIQNTQKYNIRNIFRLIYKRLHSLNIFRHSGHLERNEIISTRIFLILFITILVILIFYTSLTLTTRTIIINKPKYEKFISLDKQYSSTLVCPCSNLANLYQSFVSFSPKFHQICLSGFVDDEVLKLFTKPKRFYYSIKDLRRYAFHILATIRVFCDLSQKTVKEQINTFSLTKFVSYQAMNEEQFNVQINTIIQAIIQATQRQAIISINLTRDTTYTNQIISNLFTNVHIKNTSTLIFSPTSLSIDMTHNQYGNCNCLTSASCVTLAVHCTHLAPIFVFDGFFIGCYIFESVLRSSMNCLYSQKCINRTLLDVTTVSVTSIKHFPTALNQNINSSYNINTTFFELLNNLMLETWGQTISHRSYFNSCKPLSCNYSIISRREFTYIITMLFGIAGGLNTVLRFIIPYAVAFIMKKLNRNRIIPTINHSSVI